MFKVQLAVLTSLSKYYPLLPAGIARPVWAVRLNHITASSAYCLKHRCIGVLDPRSEPFTEDAPYKPKETGNYELIRQRAGSHPPTGKNQKSLPRAALAAPALSSLIHSLAAKPSPHAPSTVGRPSPRAALASPPPALHAHLFLGQVLVGPQ